MLLELINYIDATEKYISGTHTYIRFRLKVRVPHIYDFYLLEIQSHDGHGWKSLLVSIFLKSKSQGNWDWTTSQRSPIFKAIIHFHSRFRLPQTYNSSEPSLSIGLLPLIYDNGLTARPIDKSSEIWN